MCDKDKTETLRKYIEGFEREVGEPDANLAHLQQRVAAWNWDACDDPALVSRHARLAEALGSFAVALRSWNRVIQLDDSDPRPFRNLANLRLDLGQPERALRCLQALLERTPEDEDAARMVDELQGGTSSLQEATSPSTQELPLPKNITTHAPQMDDADTRRHGFPLAGLEERVTDEALALFLERFGGREGVYARQWVNRHGRTGYAPVEKPLTLTTLRRHLLGDLTLGVYQLRHDNDVRWAVLDIDVSASARQDARTPRQHAALIEDTHETACALMAVAHQYGLTPLLEDSGGKGRHLWFFFEHAVSAGDAKRLLRWLVSRSDAYSRHVDIEVFPKQSFTRKGPGNLVKLPLGIHRGTQRRCHFLNVHGEVQTRPFELLSGVSPIDEETMRELVALSPGEWGDATFEVEGGADSAQSSGGGLSMMNTKGPYALETDEEVKCLRTHCPMINDIMERVSRDRVITDIERRVITYTVGHVDEGANAVNAILGMANNVSREYLIKTRHKGQPMGCKRIRRELSHIAKHVGCNCRFVGAASYDHPLLHLEAMRMQSRLSLQMRSMSEADVQRLSMDWLRAESEIRRLEALIEDIAGRLTPLVIERGRVDVVGGTLIATEAGGIRKLNAEEVARLDAAIEGADTPAEDDTTPETIH